MTQEQFQKAIEIISVNHSTRIFINKPTNGFVGTLGTKTFTIHISDCCASVINNLTAEGFSLSMQDGMTSVSYYGGML